MATVFKKSNSRFWYAQYYDSTGKRVAKSTGKEKRREAEKVAEDMESADRKQARNSDNSKPFAVVLETAARDAGAGALTLERAAALLDRMKKLANPDFRETSVKDAWGAWRADQAAHIGESTARGYRQDEAILAEGLGPRLFEGPLSALLDSDISKALVVAAKKQGRKAVTVNKAFATFRRMLEWAATKKMIPANPARQVRALPQRDSLERGPFTAVEVRRLIDAAKEGNRQCSDENADEWAGAILIAAHTGLRMGDIVKLSREHVDGTRFVIRPCKTERTKKTISVPLSPPAIGWISDRKGLFFPSIAKISAPDRSTRFSAIMDKAGVPKAIIAPGGIKMSRSFHSLRHTFASWLAEADVHADVRQKLTGHSSSKIHQRYTHHDKALDRAVGTLPDL